MAIFQGTVPIRKIHGKNCILNIIFWEIMEEMRSKSVKCDESQRLIKKVDGVSHIMELLILLGGKVFLHISTF